MHVIPVHAPPPHLLQDAGRGAGVVGAASWELGGEHGLAAAVGDVGGTAGLLAVVIGDRIVVAGVGAIGVGAQRVGGEAREVSDELRRGGDGL